MGMDELFPTAVKKYIPRVQFILAVLHEAAFQDNIWPSTCRAEIATVADHAAHYARESRRHHHAAKISRPAVKSVNY